MTSPNSSYRTTLFPLSGDAQLDALLSEYREKWGGMPGEGVSLTFSFPWQDGRSAWFQTPTYSDANEPAADVRFGFDAVQRQATRLALQAWTEVAQVTFVETAESRTGVGDFRFAFSSAAAEVWGWCTYPDDYWAAAGDVWVNPEYAGEDWRLGSYDFQALMHEIGHGLGLKHPGNYDGDTPGPYLPAELDDRGHSIMSYHDRDNVYPQAGYVDGVWGWLTYYVYPETPMVLDMLAIQYLYGANMTTRSGDDVYSFDSGIPFLRTLWDAGGEDTIDASDYSLGCVIDLTPGSYSSLHIAPAADTGGQVATYDGSDCLGIAYGCWIENAVGGAGDDLLLGNAGDNGFDGGAGSDVLVLSGRLADYEVHRAGTELMLSDSVAGRDGVDTAANVESFRFADGTRSWAQLAQVAVPIDTKGPADAGTVYVFRSEKTGPGINPASYSYYYTTNAGAADFLSSMPSWPWVQKTATFEAAHSNPDLAVPVFQFWSDLSQSHFFTVGEADRDWLIARSAAPGDAWDWAYEGEGFSVYTSAAPTDAVGKAAIPVYRLWIDDKDFDPANGIVGGHYFTADRAEYEAMAALVGVVAEGVAFYGEAIGA